MIQVTYHSKFWLKSSDSEFQEKCFSKHIVSCYGAKSQKNPESGFQEHYPVFLLNFRKIPRVVSKNYAFGVLAPICKIRQEFFQSIHHCQFYLLVVSSCFFKFEKNLLSESLEPCLGILINGPFFGQSDHCCHSCLLIVLYCCTLL